MIFIHPREDNVKRSILRLLDAVDAVCKEEGLTEGEYLRVISEVFGEGISRTAKYMIRMERHGDYDKAGGLV